MSNIDQSKIVHTILSSKKYKALYPKTVDHIVQECAARYPAKLVEEQAKNLLHQIWGAYYSSRPRFDKLIKDISDKHQEKFLQSIQQIILAHSSTKERIPIYQEFYQQIFEITSYPESIIDHACGLNPLFFFLLDLPQPISYTAYDIDQEEIEFLRTISDIHPHSHITFEFHPGDILTDTFPYADVVFMLKLLPCLERQQKNRTLEILQKQLCKYLVVSFPIRSLSGKQKGMEEFYSKSFREMIQHENWNIHELIFNNEIVFIIRK